MKSVCLVQTYFSIKVATIFFDDRVEAWGFGGVLSSRGAWCAWGTGDTGGFWDIRGERMSHAGIIYRKNQHKKLNIWKHLEFNIIVIFYIQTLAFIIDFLNMSVQMCDITQKKKFK